MKFLLTVERERKRDVNRRKHAMKFREGEGEMKGKLRVSLKIVGYGVTAAKAKDDRLQYEGGREWIFWQCFLCRKRDSTEAENSVLRRTKNQ